MSDHPVISERDRQEASAVTLQGSGHVFEIQLGHLCNNRCVFCSSGMLTQQGLARPVPLDDILAAIQQAREAGARRLIFLGGEPTLHKGFLKALEHTVAVGFEDIVIFTNGVLLPQPGFIDKVVALGNFEWRISIQGADEASHVAVTGRKQSFSRIMTGLRELAQRGQRVTMNMCVNAHSYKSLPGYPELVREHGIAQVHVDIIRPASTGRRSLIYFEEIMPRYTEMAPYLQRMLEGFEEANLGIEVSVGNLPICVLRRWPRAVFHGGEDTVTVASDEAGLEPEVDKYAWHAAMRRHVPACEGCVMRDQCTGVFETYLELHGDSEFRAIDEAELLELPPARRPFLALAQRRLAALLDRAERPPAPFVLDHQSRDRIARVVSLTFRMTRQRVTLRFESPELSGSAMWAEDGAPIIARDPVWQLAAVVDPSVSRSELRSLLEWATPEKAQEALASWEQARALAPLRVRALRILARLRAAEPPAGWCWTQAQPEAEPAPAPTPAIRASLVRTDAPEQTLEIVLTLSTEAGRRPIELDFRRAAQTDADAANSAIEALVAELKRPAQGRSQPQALSQTLSQQRSSQPPPGSR